MWRFYPLRRFPMCCEKISVQKLPKFRHFTSLCFMKGQQKLAYQKPHKPKEHQLTAGDIQAYDSQSESEQLLLSPAAD